MSLSPENNGPKPNLRHDTTRVEESTPGPCVSSFTASVCPTHTPLSIAQSIANLEMIRHLILGAALTMISLGLLAKHKAMQPDIIDHTLYLTCMQRLPKVDLAAWGLC